MLPLSVYGVHTSWTCDSGARSDHITPLDLAAAPLESINLHPYFLLQRRADASCTYMAARRQLRHSLDYISMHLLCTLAKKSPQTRSKTVIRTRHGCNQNPTQRLHHIRSASALTEPKFSSFPGLQGCNPGGPCTYSHCPLPKEIDERDKSAPFVIYSVTIKTKTLKQHNIRSWKITITDFTGYRDQTTLLARLSYSRVDRILHPLHPSPHPPAMAAQSPHVVAFLDCFSQRVTSAPGPCARAVTCKCA
jgi:hypothetical protein